MGAGGASFSYADVRYVAVGTLNSINANWLRVSQNASTGNGGTCYGDSGGQNFLGAGSTETDIVAATTITGDSVFRSTNVDYRSTRRPRGHSSRSACRCRNRPCCSARRPSLGDRRASRPARRLLWGATKARANRPRPERHTPTQGGASPASLAEDDTSRPRLLASSEVCRLCASLCTRGPTRPGTYAAEAKSSAASSSAPSSSAKAATTSGSNCVPAQRASSVSASDASRRSR